MHQVQFHPCLSEEAIQLQQIIEVGSTDAEDTLGLGTAFLIIKDIEIHQKLKEVIEPVILANLFLDSLDGFTKDICLSIIRFKLGKFCLLKRLRGELRGH